MGLPGFEIRIDHGYFSFHINNTNYSTSINVGIQNKSDHYDIFQNILFTTMILNPDLRINKNDFILLNIQYLRQLLTTNLTDQESYKLNEFIYKKRLFPDLLDDDTTDYFQMLQHHHNMDVIGKSNLTNHSLIKKLDKLKNDGYINSYELKFEQIINTEKITDDYDVSLIIDNYTVTTEPIIRNQYVIFYNELLYNFKKIYIISNEIIVERKYSKPYRLMPLQSEITKIIESYCDESLLYDFLTYIANTNLNPAYPVYDTYIKTEQLISFINKPKIMFDIYHLYINKFDGKATTYMNYIEKHLESDRLSNLISDYTFSVETDPHEKNINLTIWTGIEFSERTEKYNISRKIQK